MNVLVLNPGRRNLGYAFFREGRRPSSSSGVVESYRGAEHDLAGITRSLEGLRKTWQDSESPQRPDVVGLRVPFGGTEFRTSAIADSEAERRLESLIPQSPLHLPAVLGLVRSCREVFPATQTVLVFETAYFADLATRESLYGLDVEMMGQLGVRRYGFHGIYHEAAVGQTLRRRRDGGNPESPRVVSICMEPRPELAAATTAGPLMVTGGATPIEGLPGLTTCGELDPGIALILRERLGWGPEQIDRVLTHESGLTGLLGHPTSWETLFASTDPEMTLPREIIEYRLLQACGAAIACMGGLDAIVFSGRSAGVGRQIGPKLISKLAFLESSQPRPVSWECYEESLDRLVADAAVVAERSAATVR